MRGQCVMIKFENRYGIECVDVFLRLYGDILRETFAENGSDSDGQGGYPGVIYFRPLPDEENEYGDVVVKLDDSVYISERQIGKMGFSMPELFAILAHELGHILYHTHPWGFDSEERADSLAAELGLGSQMISALERIIASRRFRNVTSALVRRIQFLQHLA